MTTARFRVDARPAPGQFVASKVPVITVYFWIIKVLTTGMGETTSDFLVHRFDPYTWSWRAGWSSLAYWCCS